MKSLIHCLIVLVLCFLTNCVASNVQAQAPGRLFVVDFNGDTVDSNAGDGECRDASLRCSLRAAIEEANATTSTADAILFALPDPSIIDLTLGELEIKSQIAIVGPGARRLTVQRSFAAGTPDFRIFHIFGFHFGATVRGITVRNGRITGALFGGGFYVDNGLPLTLVDVTVSNNFALYGGGLANAGSVNITRSLFTGNRGNNWAGAIYNMNNPVRRPVWIKNSTITGNSANAHGAISNDGTLLLVNSTITHNSADEITSGIASYSEGTVTVLNTIIGSDTSPTLTSLGGAFISLGNNIVTDARNSTGFVNGVNGDQVSNSNAIDPLLGSLMNNGGQTDTRALLAGSPAINTGNNCVLTGKCSTNPVFRLTTDQRPGFDRRFAGTVDIGAFERDSTLISGSASFGFGVFNRPASYAGSIAILTDAVTLEKRYAPVSPFGSTSFRNIPLGVYIFEIKSKRAGLSQGPLVVDLYDFGLPLSPTVPGASITQSKN